MDPSRWLHRFAVGLLFVVVVPVAAAAQAGAYDSFYAFGDSLADNGNIFIGTKALGRAPAVPPSEVPHRTYFGGRFSNGPVSFEYLWQLLSGHAPGSSQGLKPFLAAPLLGRTGAVNFAFGGTGTGYLDQTPGGDYAPGLKGQVELFRFALRGRKPSNRALFAIVTGANEYRAVQFQQPMAPADVVDNISHSIRVLYSLRARNVMVLTLPDLGLLPGNAGAGGVLSEITRQHNQLLAAAVADLSSRLHGINLMLVDINAVFALLPPSMDLTTPAIDAFFPGPFPPGFRMSLCLYIDPATCADVPTFDIGQQFLFWDGVHPTTEAHRILAQYLYGSLVP